MAIIERERSDVRIQEFDFTSLMTNSANDVAAIVLVSAKGDTKPRKWLNSTRFVEHYGEPNPKISQTIQSALNYFTRGSNLWAIRAVGAGARISGMVLYRILPQKQLALRPLPNGIEDLELIDWEGLAQNPNEEVLGIFYPDAGPGSYGDSYGADIITQDPVAPTGLKTTVIANEGTYAPGTYKFRIASIGPKGVTVASAEHTVIIAGGTTNAAIKFEWVRDTQSEGVMLYGRTTNGMGLIAELGRSEVEYVDEGDIPVDQSITPIINAQDAPPPSPIFNLRFFNRDVSNAPLETWAVSFDSTEVDASGVSLEIEQRVNALSAFMRFKSNTFMYDDLSATNVPKTFMQGGDSGAAVTASDIRRAWEKFKNRRLYGISSMINGGITIPTVQHKMDEIAQLRGDSIALLDTPSLQQAWDKAIDYRNLQLRLNSTYSALFCPDMLIQDDVSNSQIYTPFSGFAAALCAYTDRVANSAWSIAGLNRGLIPQALGTRHEYEDEEETEMFRAQVNYTRTLTAMPTALWEQQTLQSGVFSALNWLSVRRLANVIKVAAYNYGLIYLQEQNDEFTIRGFLKVLERYLDSWVTARGIKGYDLVSDSRNNTEDMEIAGIRDVIIIIYPTIPIHRLNIKLAISRTSISVDEIVDSIGGL